MEKETMTTMQEIMKERKISCRDLSAYTGTNLSLVNYITRGLAKFPTEDELKKCCEMLNCSPADLYPKRTMQVYYPKTTPQKPPKPRDKYGNPSVRVKATSVQLIKERGENVADFVNRAVEKLLTDEANCRKEDVV